MRRREEMLRIIREAAVRSQDELLGLLRHRGYSSTQPTLSRDLRELGVAKGPRGYMLPGPLPVPARPVAAAPGGGLRLEKREEKLARVVREFVLSVETAGSLVVLRTPPADASPVARVIDEAGLSEIVGTISGDDTIFLAVRSAASAARLAHRFQTMIAPGSRPRTASRSARPRRSKRA